MAGYWIMLMYQRILTPNNANERVIKMEKYAAMYCIHLCSKCDKIIHQMILNETPDFGTLFE